MTLVEFPDAAHRIGVVDWRICFLFLGHGVSSGGVHGGATRNTVEDDNEDSKKDGEWNKSHDRRKRKGWKFFDCNGFWPPGQISVRERPAGGGHTQPTSLLKTPSDARAEFGWHGRRFCTRTEICMMALDGDVKTREEKRQPWARIIFRRNQICTKVHQIFWYSVWCRDAPNRNQFRILMARTKSSIFVTINTHMHMVNCPKGGVYCYRQHVWNRDPSPDCSSLKNLVQVWCRWNHVVRATFTAGIPSGAYLMHQTCTRCLREVKS